MLPPEPPNENLKYHDPYAYRSDKERYQRECAEWNKPRGGLDYVLSKILMALFAAPFVLGWYFYRGRFLTNPSLSSTNTKTERVCKVIDSTGTPLNIRDTPNGKTINQLKKGKEVYVLETAKDQQNQSWVKIAGYHESKYRTWGWAIKKYINC